MKYDIILCGVGGQGVLSVAAVIARAAQNAGLFVRQSEVHGMAQRGGAVLSHLRISDKVIYSDLVPRGTADLILSMEPLESLRYIGYLEPRGALITSSEPFINIPHYPDVSGILGKIEALPHARWLEIGALARRTGSVRTANMVLVGAALRVLPFGEEHVKKASEDLFARKGEKAVAMNEKALRLGQEDVP